MEQSTALKILKSKKNVLLTGSAGSGKTYVLNEFIEYLEENKILYAATASTGISATYINGVTIHSWTGLGIAREIEPHFYDSYTFRNFKKPEIKAVEVLIIDEISMLSANMFNMVDAVLRTVKKSKLPFGGIQVVICGDFFQLPPIGRDDQFVFESDAFLEAQFNVCYLSKQFRQDDLDYFDFLNCIRNNISTSKFESSLINENEPDSAVPRLFTHNSKVDSYNQAMLNAIDSPVYEYNMSSDGERDSVNFLKKNCRASENIRLKKGAIVMTIKNNQKEGYFNGSVGEIVDFEKVKNVTYPVVKFSNGESITIKEDRWERRKQNLKTKEVELVGKIEQLPLTLAWAISVHKSQGITLEKAVVDLTNCFEVGMGYVAFSRLKGFSGLFLEGVNSKAFEVSKTVLDFDKVLKRMSEESESRADSPMI